MMTTATKPLIERIREEMDAWQDERAVERVTAELLAFAEQVRAMRCEGYPDCLTVKNSWRLKLPDTCDGCKAIDKILAMLGAEKDGKK